jgi:hypothetical protein
MFLSTQDLASQQLENLLPAVASQLPRLQTIVISSNVHLRSRQALPSVPSLSHLEDLDLQVSLLRQHEPSVCHQQ